MQQECHEAGEAGFAVVEEEEEEQGLARDGWVVSSCLGITTRI